MNAFASILTSVIFARDTEADEIAALVRNFTATSRRTISFCPGRRVAAQFAAKYHASQMARQWARPHSEHMEARRRLRQIVTTLVWIGLGTVPLSLALADPSASPNSAETKATSSTAAPATAPAAASAAAPAGQPAASPSDVDPREKLLLRMGFKPRMQNGQKLFCKHEQQLGSRVEGTMQCGTLDHWVNQFQLSREAVDQTQRYGTNPTGH